MAQAEGGRTPAEPAWLVRAVVVLLLVGLAAYAAHEAWRVFG